MQNPDEIFELLKKYLRYDNDFEIAFSNNTLTLEETKEDSKLKKVFITDVQMPYFAFKFDAFEPNLISNYFQKHKKGLNAGCDAILFVKFEEKYYILFCELKSSDEGCKSYKPQFLSSLCFIDYVEILLQNNEEAQADFSDFTKKFILFFRNKQQDENISLMRFDGKNISPCVIRNKYKIRKFGIKKQRARNFS